MMKILILDGDTVPALTIARSLGSKGVSVDIAAHHKNPISSFSKHVIDTHCYPHPLHKTNEFVSWIKKQLEQKHYQLIIPATERTLVPIARTFDGTPYEQQIAMPALDSLEAVLDKAKSATLANQCDVPLPQSWDITNVSDLEQHSHAFTYPVVIKPGRSISDSGRRTQLTVRYAHNAEELNKICTELLKETHLVLQSYFSGTGVGIELIAQQGEILYAFQHQRLHEMPLTGGGSSYRKSVAINPDLLAASKRLIKALNWHGVAMVEFKINLQTGDFIFIEINGRFWGSLPLAVAAGADFPYMLYQLYRDGEVTDTQPYRPEIACRKLSSDIAWFECVLRKDADLRLVTLPPLRSACADMLAMFKFNDYLDVQSFSDLKPGFVDLLNIAKTYIRRFKDKSEEARYRKTVLANSNYAKIKMQLSSANNILFLCYGNINRSAAAHVLAEQLCHDLPQVTFKSAGFHPNAGRPADPRMCKIAQANQTDMSQCRSQVLDQALIDWADIIFVMESDHVKKLTALSDAATPKTYLLGGLHSKQKAIEIADPYNKPTAVYADIFNKIHQTITALKSILT